MQVDLKRFHAAFFDEANEHLATLEECLLSLEREPADSEQLNRIFRAAHSIKGASGTFGFGDIAAFTHSLEGLLDRMRSGDILPTPNLVELLLQASDVLGGLVSAAKDGGPLPEAVEKLVHSPGCGPRRRPSRLGGHCGARGPDAAGGCLSRLSGDIPARADVLHFGMDPLLLLRDLAEIGTLSDVSADTSQLPDLAALVPDECYLGWTMRLATAKSLEDIRAVFVFVEDGTQIQIEALPAAGDPSPPPPAAQAAAAAVPASTTPAAHPAAAPKPEAHPARPRNLESSSIRVSVEKVDELINLVGELVIAQSMVNQVVSHIPGDLLPGMQEALGIMDRSTRDLQERVMSVRMVPLANVFQRFPRLVRDLAATLGKQINVEITGEDTELDKQMIEQIADPLTHMIRNAVDHGIGLPDERQRAGKTPTARLPCGPTRKAGTW